MNTSTLPRFGWLTAFLVVLVSFIFAAPHLHAQDTTTTASPVNGVDASNIVTWLTPLLVPLIIAAKKKIFPSIPGWVLPLIAPVLGVALDYVNSLATSHQHNFVLAALLGLAGVGVREVKDQFIPANPSPVA